MVMKLFYRSILFILFLLASCVSTVKTDQLILEPASFSEITGWNTDNINEAFPALERSCKKILLLPDDRNMGGSAQFGKAVDWKPVCKALPHYDSSDYRQLKAFFEANFVPYRVKNNNNTKGLFTGYYETALRGSLTRHDQYQFPLYRLPPDVKSGTSYFSRKEIENGALDGKNLELVYVDDPVQLFFLHIQGSGRVQLDTGQSMGVGYAGKNNREYISLGKVMIEKGYIPREKMSATAIKSWLYSHPDEANALMDMNPSYVFFRELQEKNPVGAQGVELTPNRSLAVDKAHLPYGALVWLQTHIPAQYSKSGVQWNRLMVAQDTGGAIKGPVRGDIFFGYGDEAEFLASHMQNFGEYFVLLPRQIGTPAHGR